MVKWSNSGSWSTLTKWDVDSYWLGQLALQVEQSSAQVELVMSIGHQVDEVVFERNLVLVEKALSRLSTLAMMMMASPVRVVVMVVVRERNPSCSAGIGARTIHVQVFGQDDSEGFQDLHCLPGHLLDTVGRCPVVAIVGDAFTQVQLELELRNDHVQFVDGSSTIVSVVARLHVVVGVEL